MNSYARKNDYSSIELKATDIVLKDIDLSQVTKYQVVLKKDLILSSGERSPGKLFIIDNITLQRSHLGPLKTEQELYQEIIQKIESVYKKPDVSTQSVVADRPQSSSAPLRTRSEVNTESYNQKFFKANKARFEAVQGKVNQSKDPKIAGLSTLMDTYMKDQSSSNALKIQKEINSKFDTKLNPDKDFGPLTLGALEQIVGIRSVQPTPPSTPTAT